MERGIFFTSFKMQKKLWRFPWSYPESIIVVLGIIAIGIVVQVELGPCQLDLLAYPVNLLILFALIIFCIACAFIDQSAFVKWFSSIAFSITLLCAILILGVAMGLTPQRTTSAPGNLLATMGLTHMTVSWPFVLVYITTLLSLGALITRRLKHWRPLTLSFHFNHIGLWILLVAAGLGQADMRRYIMYPELLMPPQWEVYSSNGQALELPIGIQLNRFEMQTYSAKIAIIDDKTGDPLPLAEPVFFQLEAGSDRISIMGWHIEVLEYIHKAAPSENGFRPWPVVGAAPAAYIRAYNPLSQEEKTGWITSGSAAGYAQPVRVLALDSQLVLVMLEPEAKHFASDISVYTWDLPNEAPIRTTLTVNNPLKVGDWYIYQYGYDQDAGAMSVYSAIELIYDPWLYAVYLGFGLMALGSFGMIWRGRKKVKESL